MAQLFPEDIQISDKKVRFSNEIATLIRLKEGISDQYMVFHGVHWTRIEDDAAIYGEIDFLIVNPYGRVLAIEQKETQIEKSKQGELLAIYQNENGHKSEKNIRFQVTRNIQSLRQEFSRRYPSNSIEIDHLLYLPTATIVGTLPANVALGRVVDASEADQLCEIITDIFERNPMPSIDGFADALLVREFLSEKAKIAPQVGLLGKSAKAHSTRLSNGLAEWTDRLEFSPFRLWVQGTAGSGKTQLALNELKKAKRNNQIAMYLCYNRPLADSMKMEAPRADTCMTFHELAVWFAKQMQMEIDFQKQHIFGESVDYFLANIKALEGTLDVLVVDEGQDFEKSWGHALISMVKEGGRIIWLEDPSQDVYKRWDTDWSSWVKISSPINYRSPQRIVNLMNSLELTPEYIEAGNGYAGMVPEICPYEEGAVIEATEKAVMDLINEGYAPESIAVLSFRGVQSSSLLASNLTSLAGFPIKKFLGYTESGSTNWSQGNLVVDTLFRFKGQCADAVVITEIDFDEWDDNIKKRLFVGLTRARLMVSLVVTEKTDALLSEKLGLS